jgi:hypothetical protein
MLNLILSSILIVLSLVILICVLLVSRRANEVAMSVDNLPIVVREQAKSAFEKELGQSNLVRTYSIVLDGASMRMIRQKKQALFDELVYIVDLSTAGTYLITVPGGRAVEGSSVEPYYYCSDKVEFVAVKKTSDYQVLADDIASKAVRHLVIGNCMFTVLNFVAPLTGVASLLPLKDMDIFALIKYDASSYFCDDQIAKRYAVPPSAMVNRSAQDRIHSVYDLIGNDGDTLPVSVLAK